MTVLSIYKKFRARIIDAFVLLTVLVIFVFQAAGAGLDDAAAFNQQSIDPSQSSISSRHP